MIIRWPLFIECPLLNSSLEKKIAGHLFGTVFNILNIYMMSFSCELFFKCYSRFKEEHMTMWVGAVHLLVWLHLLNYEIDLSSNICTFLVYFYFIFSYLSICISHWKKSQIHNKILLVKVWQYFLLMKKQTTVPK